MSALFRATSATGFDRLYRHHAATVYRYAYAVIGNHADAEDVTQQTFLNAYRALTQGTKPRKAENWLLTIAHNEVRRHFRSSRGKALEVEFDERLAHPAPERSDRSLADVLRALQHLPPAQRSALVMREFEGRSYAEIAQIMNVTQSALEALIFRARRALADHFQGALTCAEAERALSRRLDGRLPRRDARRLKAHLHECPLCLRFANIQKRQRSLLKGLSVMPVPASLFLFRGEQAAAAAGLSAGAAAAGGSVAVGGGGAAAAAAGATGIVAGFVVKAAAVTAAAAVVGGVGYGVATGSDTSTKAERKVAHAAVVAQTRRGGRAAEVKTALARGNQPGPARPANARARRKADKAKGPSANSETGAKKSRRGETPRPVLPAHASRQRSWSRRTRRHERQASPLRRGLGRGLRSARGSDGSDADTRSRHGRRAPSRTPRVAPSRRRPPTPSDAGRRSSNDSPAGTAPPGANHGSATRAAPATRVNHSRANLQRCDWSYSKHWSMTILLRRVRGRASS